MTLSSLHHSHFLYFASLHQLPIPRKTRNNTIFNEFYSPLVCFLSFFFAEHVYHLRVVDEEKTKDDGRSTIVSVEEIKLSSACAIWEVRERKRDVFFSLLVFFSLFLPLSIVSSFYDREQAREHYVCIEQCNQEPERARTTNALERFQGAKRGRLCGTPNSNGGEQIVQGEKCNAI